MTTIEDIVGGVLAFVAFCLIGIVGIVLWLAWYGFLVLVGLTVLSMVLRAIGG